jgi:hypothetical protein
VNPNAPEYLMKGLEKVAKEFNKEFSISKLAGGYTSHFKHMISKNEESHKQ